MFLFLGKYKDVTNFLMMHSDVFSENFIEKYPLTTSHYSEFPNYIHSLKEKNLIGLLSQNLEFIDLLLQSDIPVQVVCIHKCGEEFKVKEYTKEKAWKLRTEVGFDLRCMRNATQEEINSANSISTDTGIDFYNTEKNVKELQELREYKCKVEKFISRNKNIILKIPVCLFVERLKEELGYDVSL